jgi:hypothetical protein
MKYKNLPKIEELLKIKNNKRKQFLERFER